VNNVEQVFRPAIFAGRLKNAVTLDSTQIIEFSDWQSENSMYKD